MEEHIWNNKLEGRYDLIITQEKLVNQIAETEGINVTTVQKIFKSAENIIFAHLSSASPTENILVRFFKGISLESKCIEKKEYSKGIFQNITCPEHINIKAKVSRYYSTKVNEEKYNK